MASEAGVIDQDVADATFDDTQGEKGFDTGPQPQEPPDGELVVEGSGQLSFEVGGKAPTTSALTLVGGRVDIEGSFQKGERVALYVECEVREVAFRDERDAKTGQVIGCKRVHKAAITGVDRQGE